MIDQMINIANGVAAVGNLLIAGVTAYGYFKFGRRSFLLLFLLATPIVILMALLNSVACMGTDVVHAVFPGKTFAILSLLCNGLYPLAMLLSLAGTVLMIRYVADKEERGPNIERVRTAP
jgi:hypothetical protein